eukprot:1741023-Amphidinium_carterae.1
MPSVCYGMGHFCICLQSPPVDVRLARSLHSALETSDYPHWRLPHRADQSLLLSAAISSHLFHFWRSATINATSAHQGGHAVKRFCIHLCRCPSSYWCLPVLCQASLSSTSSNASYLEEFLI